MKDLKSYLCEGFKFGKNKMKKYSCQPQTKDELRKIIEKRLAKDKDADLNDIDVSEIEDMDFVFRNFNPHNIAIDKWNVSGVQSMRMMFYGCENFEGKGLENWDVSNVENMEEMFTECTKFNGDLGNWNMSKVWNINSMFNSCENFEGKGLENWDVSNIVNSQSAFYGCKKFNCDLGNWDVSKLESAYAMFYNCENFEGKGLENWKVNNLTYTHNLFNDVNKLKHKPSWCVNPYYN